MNLHRMVWKELGERPTAMLTSVLAIFVGVAALVAIRHVTVFSEQEVSRQLSTLGANILVLPKSASLQDYYAADFNGQTLPEEYSAQILLAGLTGVEKISPRLSVPVKINDQPVTLTGILPQQEFQAKSAWQTTSLLQKKHAGCKRAACGPKKEDLSPESLVSERTIQKLGPKEAVIGADLAGALHVKQGASLELLGDRFEVVAVLPATGTVDDSRVFAHLHTVQRLAKAGEVVSAIEIFGCCEDAAGQLVPQLSQLLPETRVVTISQVVQTQVGVNRLMAKTSLCVLVVMVLLGGASVLGTIASNVRERRREIGTLMAMGATPRFVAALFLLKAIWLGLLGGLTGSVLGIVLAVVLGPAWAGVQISPLPMVAIVACGAAVGLTLAAAYLPARKAAGLDPCVCFQEV